MTDIEPTVRPDKPKAIWWRFAIGVVFFPAIGGLVLYFCMGVVTGIGLMLSGGDLADFVTNLFESVQSLFVGLVFISIVAIFFGAPIGGLFAALGHFFSRRSAVAGAFIAAIAGTASFMACILVFSLDAPGEAGFMLLWCIAVIPISAILGWIFCRWVYPIRTLNKDELVKTFA